MLFQSSSLLIYIGNILMWAMAQGQFYKDISGLQQFYLQTLLHTTPGEGVVVFESWLGALFFELPALKLRISSCDVANAVPGRAATTTTGYFQSTHVRQLNSWPIWRWGHRPFSHIFLDNLYRFLGALPDLVSIWCCQIMSGSGKGFLGWSDLTFEDDKSCKWGLLPLASATSSQKSPKSNRYKLFT